MRPQLSRSVLDRAAHRRGDPVWLEAAWTRSRVLVVDPATGKAPVEGDPPRLRFVAPEKAPEGDRLYLGGESEPYFAVAAPVPDGAGLRETGPRLPDFDVGVLTEAVALVRWHADHIYHAASGQVTEVEEGGWSRRAGDKVSWPRTDPAVMVLITDGADRVLLANGVSWENDRYSCIAGFVEPGESAEAACHREVGEEVGVAITGLSYVASQPWPYPRSLMLAYEAVADPAQEIVCEPGEISAARWFTRAELQAALDGRPAPLRMPPSISIARYLIERWLGPS
ncbi:MAG: NAD(+) diphosphatase [Stackebrandtia sp.]